MATADRSIRKLSREMTLTVTITREFRFRTFVAVQLIRIAAWTLGCGMEMIIKESD